jgi:predicted MFS family arabinose efflux permease
MTTPDLLRRGIDASRSRPAALVLAVVCVAQFMVVLDVSIVNVALPNMQRDLGMSQNGLGWVLNAYTLTFAGFLLLGGRAADLWGRRRLFLMGVALFSLTSLIGGLAQTGGELIGVLVLIVARVAFAESRAEGERPTLDWAGALTVTGGLVALVYGIVSTDSHSWGSPLVLGCLLVGAALIVAFGWTESRHRHPLVPLRLFRSRALTGANLIMVLIGSAMFSLFFFLSQYLQDVHSYSPLRAGFAFLPMPLAIITGTQLSSRLVTRIGPRTLLVVGPPISATGLLLLSRLHADSSYLLNIGVPGALITFGVGTSFVPITLSATSSVDRADAGLSSGLINTSRQIGGSLGLAVLLTVATSRTRADSVRISGGRDRRLRPGLRRVRAASGDRSSRGAAVVAVANPDRPHTATRCGRVRGPCSHDEKRVTAFGYRARPSRRTSSQIRQYAHLARERPGNATEPEPRSSAPVEQPPAVVVDASRRSTT